MSFIENNLIDALKQSLKEAFDFDAPENFIMLEIPGRPEQGDYATNLAMRLTKQLKRNPREIAEAIKASVENLDMLEKVEIAGPGFINFFMKPTVLAEVINNVLTLGSA